jgi:probable F420-dependent oxidoreductase
MVRNVVACHHRVMELGAVYPQIELKGDPEAVRKIGLGVEAMGFDYLLAYDHVLGAVHSDREPALTGPYTEHDPFHDPFVMFAYLAGLTKTLRFASGVIILPQRQTALVARQVADLDLLSGSRFRLGVGVGWNYVEYESLGQEFHTRGARQEEQIGLLRRLWTEPVVEFAGRFDRVDRASTLPMPTRPVPIWLGGFGEIAYERAARIADGFIFGGRVTDMGEAWSTMKARVTANGRDVSGFGGEYLASSKKGPADVADKLKMWRDLGGTHGGVVTMGLGFDSPDAHLDYLGQVKAALA